MDYWEENGLVKPTEIIVCAANRYDGLIVTGARHHDNIMNAVISKLKTSEDVVGLAEQGFINQFGEFKTRKEAMEIVKINGQPFNKQRNGGSDDELYSEGLY